MVGHSFLHHKFTELFPLPHLVTSFHQFLPFLCTSTEEHTTTKNPGKRGTKTGREDGRREKSVKQLVESG
jgi:hypothetical protein